MNQYPSISALKDAAKEKLTGHFGSAILLTFINGAMLFCADFIINMLLSTLELIIAVVTTGSLDYYVLSPAASGVLSILEYLLTLLCSLLAGVFNTGICLFFLNLASGRTAALSNLFYGFQYLFKKSLALSAVSTLLNALCMLPYQICSFMFRNASLGDRSIYMLVTLLLGNLIFLPIQLGLSQSFFLLLDFPSLSAGELLRNSFRLMKGRKCRLFLIHLSFFPMLLLGLLSFEIGNLWITPYINLVMALYFLDIMKEGEKVR